MNHVADRFREAMSHLPAAVSVVATAMGGERAGLTATAVCSVSMEPPTILVCVNRASGSYALLQRSGQFSVNVLGEAQQWVAEVFAGSRAGAAAGKFETTEGLWRAHETSMPVLEGAVAAVVCRVLACIPIGTHAIFVGEVVAAEATPGEQALIYASRGYHCLGQRLAG